MQIIMTHRRGLRFSPPVLIIRIMKLTAAFLLAISLNVSASGFSQNVTLTVRNGSLEKVFKEVRKQTGYVFFYKTNLLRSTPKISINVHNAGIKEIMDLCLTGLPLTYSILDRTVVITAKKEKAYQFESPAVDILLDIAITGTVNSTTGEPMAGASIRLKGTDIGTTTDAKGSFSLSIPDKGGVLVISYVGYQSREVAVNRNSQLKISLKLLDNTADEIVVIGYGSSSKTNLTSAISSVTAKDISNLPVIGLDQALQGRMAGVQVTQNSGEPGGNISVRIRGVGSISSGTEPLYIVDGIPMTQIAGGLNSINPNDIERIDVLKDAASAAIYGSRASNGVVLVTTKHGKAGKLSLNFDAYAGTQQSIKKIELLNGPQFATLANENLVNGGLAPNPDWNNPSSLPTYDWQDEVLGSAPVQNYNISASSGTEKSRTYFSLGYLNQDGILQSSYYKRYTARLTSDFDITKRIKVGGTFNFGYDDKTTPITQSSDKGSLNNTVRMWPINPIFSNINGDINNALYGYKGYALIKAAAPALYYPGLNNVAYIDNVHYKYPKKSTNALLAVFGEYEIINGLKFRTSFNYLRNNSFFQFSRDGVPPAVDGRGPLIAVSAYSETWRQIDQFNWINTLTYSKHINDHNFTIVAGMDALKNIYRQVLVDGSGNPPGQYNLSSIGNLNVNGYSETYSLLSYIGRITYDYKNKYLLTANFRRDGSTKFAPSKQYGNFPSASVGWRLSEEPFMKNITAINELKLRASYGIVGNQNIPNFKYASTYSNNSGLYNYVLGNTVVPASYRNNIGDPNIHWEKSAQTNLGLDAVLFNHLITLSVDYYIKKQTDILGQAPVPSYLDVPGNTITKNQFSMENKGLELLLGVNKKIGQVNFSATANFSTLENKITKLLGKATDYITQPLGSLQGDDGGSQTRSAVGERIGNFWGYVADGIIQDAAEATNSGMSGVKPGDRRFKDLNGDKKIDANDKTIIGNGLPKYIFGLNLSATYRDFDFSLFFQGQAGVQVANMFNAYSMHISGDNGFINGPAKWLNRWTGKGTSNDMPRNSYDAPSSNRYFSSAYIENGSFVRIRNMQLGYTLPVKLISKMRISSLRLYISAQNLYTFTKYSGWDPEVGTRYQSGPGDAKQPSDEVNPLTTGADYGRYPLPRTILVGLNVRF